MIFPSPLASKHCIAKPATPSAPGIVDELAWQRVLDGTVHTEDLQRALGAMKKMSETTSLKEWAQEVRNVFGKALYSDETKRRYLSIWDRDQVHAWRSSGVPKDAAAAELLAGEAS